MNRSATCATPGTHGGVKRHSRSREPLCVACAEFKAGYERARRTPAKQRRAAEARIRRRATTALIRRHRAEFNYLLLQARRTERVS